MIKTDSVIFSLRDNRKISLCAAGACPYVEISEGYVHFFDDEGKIKIKTTEQGIDIYIPREWINKIIKEITE